MATDTTTLRVPVELRDSIAELARQRHTSMVEVVSDAVRELNRQQWWSDVHDALDDLSEDDLDTYRREAGGLAGTAADGLRGD